MKYTAFLLGMILFSGVATAAEKCSYQFQADHGATYGLANYSSFIEKEIRGRLSRQDQGFTVTVKRSCSNGKKDAVAFNMTTLSLYIVGINGRTLKPDEVKYTNDDLSISYPQFEKEYADALRFDRLSKREKQHVTKMFAFMIAESARFTDVESVANTAFSSQQCFAKWSDFSNLLRHWKTMSIFANTRGIARGVQHVGGQRAFLIAPITSDMVDAYNKAVKSGWEVIRYDYDKREKDNPVFVGSAHCPS